MRRKQLEWLYINNINPQEVMNMRIKEFSKLINQLENIHFKNNEISFYCLDINTEKNINIVEENYDYLRNLFDLKPIKQLPKKKVSSLLVRLLKILKYDVINTRKYYKNSGRISTQGYYSAKSTLV